MDDDFEAHMQNGGRIDEATVIAVAAAFSGFFIGVIMMAILWWLWP